jgi:multiple sugar transport system substrate-binding protein
MIFRDHHDRILRVYWTRAGYVIGLLILLAAYVKTETPPFHSRLKIAIHEGGTGVPLLHAAEEFSARHDVEIVLAPYDELFNREWLALHAADDQERFDVIMLDDPWLAQFAPRLRPLEGKLHERLTNKDYFVKSCSRVCRIPYCEVESDCTKDSQYYAVPYVANTQLFAHGKEIGTLAGTWDAVLAKKAELEATSRPLAYTMRRGPGNSIVTDFMPILWSYCKDCWRNQIDALLPEGETAISKLFELSQPVTGGRAVGFADESLDDFDLSSYWVKDATSMGLVWSSWAMSIANIRKKAGMTDDYPVYEQVPGGHPTLGAWLLAIPANAKNRAVAEEFLGWATDRWQMVKAADRGNPPPIIGLLSKETSLSDKYRFFKAQEDALENAQPRPRTPCWKALESQIGEILYEMTAGLMNPTDARTGIDGVIHASECAPSPKQ